MTVKVLIVDDKERVLGFAKSTIDIDESYGIRMVNDADTAVAACYAEQPHLMVLDMLMPKKDGVTACRELKESPEMHDVKITLLSVTAAQPRFRPWVDRAYRELVGHGECRGAKP